jgi:hypothetical protein
MIELNKNEDIYGIFPHNLYKVYINKNINTNTNNINFFVQSIKYDTLVNFSINQNNNIISNIILNKGNSPDILNYIIENINLWLIDISYTNNILSNKEITILLYNSFNNI